MIVRTHQKLMPHGLIMTDIGTGHANVKQSKLLYGTKGLDVTVEHLWITPNESKCEARTV